MKRRIHVLDRFLEPRPVLRLARKTERVIFLFLNYALARSHADARLDGAAAELGIGARNHRNGTRSGYGAFQADDARGAECGWLKAPQ